MYGQYVQQVAPIVKKFGGRYLVRGGKITPLIGTWHPERVIILKFDNPKQVKNWLSSCEYAEIAPLRANATVSNAIVIESDALP